MSDKKIGELVILLGQIGLYFANNELPKFGAAAIQSSAMLEDLERQLAEARARLEWQPIESAPQNGASVLVWSRRGVCVARFDMGVTEDIIGVNGWLSIPGDYRLMGPTHWMPLPLPPKENKL